MSADPRASQLRSAVRVVVACLGSLVALNAVFLLLLTVVLAISRESAIEEHLRDDFGSVPSGYNDPAADTYSECLAQGVNLLETHESILYRAIAGPVVQVATDDPTRQRLVRSGSTVIRYHSSACAALEKYFHGEPSFGMPLPRFWHGYQVYTRTLLSVTTTGNMRRVTAVLLFASFVFLGFRLAAIAGGWIWPVLVVPFAVVGDLLSMPMSTTHALQVAWFFLSTAVVTTVAKNDRHSRRTWLLVCACSAGAVANFLSFLYNPSLGAGLMGTAVIAVALVADSADRNRRALIEGTLAMGFWFGGYLMTWVFKWMLAAAVMGLTEVFNDVKVAAGGGAYDWAGRPLAFLQTSWMVSKEGASHLQTMIVVCALGALVILLRYAIAGRLSRSHLIGFCVMQLPALLQIAWFESMRPHSLEHPWVVRGLFLLGICPVLGALVVARQLRATRFA